MRALIARPGFARRGRAGAWPNSLLPPRANMPTRQLADPRQEAQAKALMETIRCLVCQGQAIADSDAEMAGDMRALIRRRIAAGERPEADPRLADLALRQLGELQPPLEPADLAALGGAAPAAPRRAVARARPLPPRRSG